MQAEHDAAAIARRWCELYSDGTPDSYGSDRFLELYAPDCVWIERSRLGVRRGGVEDIRKVLPENSRLIRNRRAVLRRLVSAGGEAAMHYSWTATAAVDTPWGHKQGDTMALEIVAFVRVRDGRIVEIEELVTPHPTSGPA